MDFAALLRRYPEIVRDRHALTCSRSDGLAEVTAAFARGGVVKLRHGLPAPIVEACGETFRRFAAAHPQRQSAAGSWYPPWTVRDGEQFPAAIALGAIIRSWVWDVVEAICGSPNVAILLKWCTARHSTDVPLGVGAHQDARVVAFEVPLAIWIPLSKITPGRISGLGYVVAPQDSLLPVLPNNDIGADYVTGNLSRLWIPAYDLGDLTIHSGFSPHFTTGYGTCTDRYSLEMRAIARRSAPVGYLDPAVCVSRRNGVPTVIEVIGSIDGEVRRFLDSLERAAVAA